MTKINLFSNSENFFNKKLILDTLAQENGANLKYGAKHKKTKQITKGNAKTKSTESQKKKKKKTDEKSLVRTKQMNIKKKLFLPETSKKKGKTLSGLV